MVTGGDRLLVVGEQVGRGAAQDAEDPVQAGEDTGCGAVTQRDHHPVAAPGQPRHQQHNAAAGHDRAVSEVVLQPQPGLGDPGPVHPRIAQSPLRFDLRQRTPRGAVSAGISQRDELVVGFVAADLALRIDDPPLQHVAPIIDHPGPPRGRRQTRVAVVDRLLHGVVRAPAQLSGSPVGPGQVVGIEYFHEFSVRLQVGLSCGFRFD